MYTTICFARFIRLSSNVSSILNRSSPFALLRVSYMLHVFLSRRTSACRSSPFDALYASRALYPSTFSQIPFHRSTFFIFPCFSIAVQFFFPRSIPSLTDCELLFLLSLFSSSSSFLSAVSRVSPSSPCSLDRRRAGGHYLIIVGVRETADGGNGNDEDELQKAKAMWGRLHVLLCCSCIFCLARRARGM